MGSALMCNLEIWLCALINPITCLSYDPAAPILDIWQKRGGVLMLAKASVRMCIAALLLTAQTQKWATGQSTQELNWYTLRMSAPRTTQWEWAHSSSKASHRGTSPPHITKAPQHITMAYQPQHTSTLLQNHSTSAQVMAGTSRMLICSGFHLMLHLFRWLVCGDGRGARGRGSTCLRTQRITWGAVFILSF